MHFGRVHEQGGANLVDTTHPSRAPPLNWGREIQIKPNRGERPGESAEALSGALGVLDALEQELLGGLRIHRRGRFQPRALARGLVAIWVCLLFGPAPEMVDI